MLPITLTCHFGIDKFCTRKYLFISLVCAFTNIYKLILKNQNRVDEDDFSQIGTIKLLTIDGAE